MLLRTILGLGLAAAVSIASSASAQSGDYYLDARNPGNGFNLLLPPGTWSVGVTAGAWSPWNYLERCDAAGANCHTGFHTPFYYQIAGGAAQRWGLDGGEFETPTTSDFYATPALALAHALPPLTFNVASPTTFRAYIPDCCYNDNTGGLTLTVAQRPLVTPEPSSLALLSVGALATGVVAHRRRKRAACEER